MRFADWPSRLDGVIRGAAKRPLSYGEHDCCLFVADAVFAMTGIDAAAPFRGKYRSALAAYRLLAPMGGIVGAVTTIATQYRFEEVPPLFAQRGDVVLVRNAGRLLLGVVAPNGHIAATGYDGIVFLPLSHAVNAWRV